MKLHGADNARYRPSCAALDGMSLVRGSLDDADIQKGEEVVRYTFATMIAAALLTSAAASAASDPNVGQANKSNAQADRAAVGALAAARKKPCAVATMAG